MKNRMRWVVAFFAVVTTGCNDKMPEYGPASPASTAPTGSGPEGPVEQQKSQLSRFDGDLAALGKLELCALDAVNGEGPKDSAFEVTGAQPVTFEGWAATSSLTSPSNMTLVLSSAEGSFSISGGVTGVQRHDVATAYNAEDLANAGFKLELTELRVPAAPYSVYIVHDEAGLDIVCPSPLTVVVQ